MQKLNIEKHEEMWYASPYNLTLEGKQAANSFLAVTNKRVCVFLEGELTETIDISEIESFKCEARVGQGILILKRKALDYEELFMRFSMQHLTRMSNIARGINELAHGTGKKVISREFEKTCPVCGNPMRGKRSCSKCDKTPNSFIKFFKLCFNYKLTMAIIGLCMLVTATMSILKPKIQQVFIDDYLVKGKATMSTIVIFAVLMLVATGLFIAGDMINYYFSNKIGSSISKDLRTMVYTKIQSLSMSFINERKAGAIMNRMTRDTAEVSGFMNEAFAGIFACLINMVAAIIVMMTISVKLTLLSVVFMPIACVLSFSFFSNVFRRFHMQWTQRDKLNNGLQDVLNGIRIVKTFGTEEEESKNFQKLTGKLCKIQTRNETFFATFYPMLSFIMSMGIYVVTYLGGLKVLGESITIGQLTQLISYAWILYGPLEWMTFLPRRITQLATSLERIYDILDEEPELVDEEDAKKFDIQGEIEFKDVRFGYHSYEPVLENISFKVKKGEMIGLVGASGTGKSTMINLLMRLYDVDDGQILIDGSDIRSLKVKDYHNSLGIVLQENFLFAGTIYNNLRFAKPDATYEEIVRAAKIANAHDFILRTPDGYNTYVGEHGYSLSGGERQRISIARAVLTNPKILILDEATSNLDTESEYLIQKAIERLKAGCTTFAIAHRLSTLKDADRLIVLDGHRIAEIGSHNELMERKGIYYNLVTAQVEISRL